MPGGEPPNKRMRGDGDASSSGDAYTQVADDMCGKGKVLIFFPRSTCVNGISLMTMGPGNTVNDPVFIPGCDFDDMPGDCRGMLLTKGEPKGAKAKGKKSGGDTTSNDDCLRSLSKSQAKGHTGFTNKGKVHQRDPTLASQGKTNTKGSAEDGSKALSFSKGKPSEETAVHSKGSKGKPAETVQTKGKAETTAQPKGSKGKPSETVENKGKGKTEVETAAQQKGSKGKPSKTVENKGKGKTEVETAAQQKGSKGKPSETVENKGKGKTEVETAAQQNGSKGKPSKIVENKGKGKTEVETAKGSKGKPSETVENKGTGKTEVETAAQQKGSKGKLSETVENKGKGKTEVETATQQKGSKEKPSETVENKGKGKTEVETAAQQKGSKGKPSETVDNKGKGKTEVETAAQQKGSKGKPSETVENKGKGKTVETAAQQKGSKGKPSETVENKGKGKLGEIKGAKGKSQDSTNHQQPDENTTPGDVENESSPTPNTGETTAEAEPSSSAMARSLSSISLGQIGTHGKRIKVLTDDQKLAIQNLQKPSDLPKAERKRQFAALGRRLEKPCPPGVLAKWEASTTDEAKFEFLKSFMLDSTLSNVTVEAWHKESSKRKRENEWIKKPLDELEKTYDPAWLAEKVVAVQKGEPHPQDPTNPKKMLYSVYTGATDTRAEIDETGSKVKAKARIAQNKAMRAGVAAVLTTRAAERAAIPLQNGGTGVKAERKAAPVKKEKKEKTEEQEEQARFQKECGQISTLANKARSVAMKITATGIQHQEQMKKALEDQFGTLKTILDEVNDMTFKGETVKTCLAKLSAYEDDLKECDKKIKEGEIIVQGHERRQSIEKRKAEAKLKPKAKCKSKSKAKKEKAKVEETLPTNHFEGLADTELDEENSDYVDGMPYSDDDESMGEPKEE